MNSCEQFASFNLSLCQKLVTITTDQVWLTWRPQIPQSTVDDKVAILIKLKKKKTVKQRDYKSFTMIILSSDIQYSDYFQTQVNF